MVQHSVPDLMEIGDKLLGRREVQPGVEDIMGEVHVEGTFPDGTKLVAVVRRSLMRQDQQFDCAVIDLNSAMAHPSSCRAH
jgi:hypothetical protein